jgi:DNA-binding NarL/FixJ family response regulator
MFHHKEIANSKIKVDRARILIADGHRLFAEGLKAMLMIKKKMGVPVIAESGEETLQLLAKQEYDLLITEMKLPGISGIELTNQVKKLYPDLKVLVLSFIDNHEVTQSFFALEPDGYLLKTSDPDHYFQAIDYLLD